jgi:hypothetical protein
MFGFSTFKNVGAPHCSEDSGANPQSSEEGKINSRELSDFLTANWMDFANPC